MDRPSREQHLFTHYYERILALDLVPEWHETKYTNPKYLKYLLVMFRKLTRNGPRYVNLEGESYYGFCNNLTLKLALMKYSGGHYMLTPIKAELKLCDFFLKEPFLGQMFYKQLPSNVTCPFHAAIDLVPEWHETEYINPKYLKYLNVTFRKYSRNGRRYINMEAETLTGAGNNLTLRMALYEFLGGHYIPTPIQGETRFCDFLLNEPFLGQMYYKQLPPNMTCPFPAGEYHIMNLSLNLENFPYTIPFTYSSLIVKIRFDLQGVATATNEEVFRWKTFDRLTQTIPKGSKKKKPKTKTSFNQKGLDKV